MKKLYISLLTMFAFAGTASAQQAIDFEPTGAGANYVWNMFENATNPPLEFVANPSSSGINTSSTVAKFTALQVGQLWSGTEINHTNGMPDWTLTMNNAIIKIMVYKTVMSPVKIKLATPAGKALIEKSVTNTLINQWEELTFDFADYVGAYPVYDQIVIFPDFGTEARTQDNIIYFDNITFSQVTTVPPAALSPTVAASTPTAPAGQVISLFSNAYTGVTMSTWLTDWSESALEDVQIAGNATKKYYALNFAGMEPVANINATSMNYFNFDVWSGAFTQLRIKLVDFGANGVWQGGDDSEHEITFNNPGTQQWIHFSIPMTDFVNMTGRSNIKQIIFSSSATNVFLDNIYFSNNSTAGTNDFAPAKTMVYPNPAKDVLNIKSTSAIDEVSIYNTLGQQVLTVSPKISEATVSVSHLQNGIYMVNTVINGVSSTQKFIKQ